MHQGPPSPLGPLPVHLRREQALLTAAGIGTWQALAALGREELRALARRSRAGERRLLQLHAQARLVVEVALAPHQAALLLHAGVADRRALANADAHQLQRAVARLQLRLIGPGPPPPDLATLRRWILDARACFGRSGN
jgi:hypothetical protein